MISVEGFISAERKNVSFLVRKRSLEVVVVAENFKGDGRYLYGGVKEGR